MVAMENPIFNPHGTTGYRSEILSYRGVFLSYEAQTWYTDHVYGIEANYIKFGNIISHYDFKMKSYSSKRTG